MQTEKKVFVDIKAAQSESPLMKVKLSDNRLLIIRVVYEY